MKLLNDKPEKPKQRRRLILKVGLPASGKSTDARKQLETNGALMRLNRDEMRKMMFNNWRGKKEGAVSAAQKAMAIALLKDDWDVIIDDTNLNPDTVASWTHLATTQNAILEIEKHDATVEECVARDAGRPDSVGRHVIDKMALNYGLLTKLDPDRKVVIFDIDGTMADCMHRKKYLELCRNCNETFEFHEPHFKHPACLDFKSGKKNHKIFYKLVKDDSPIQTVIDWCNTCYYGGYEVLAVTGRPDDVAGRGTVDWLRNHGAHYHHIFMRPGGDFRSDTIIKKEILDKICKWINKDQILFAVDDRPCVIRMWKENGIHVYDVGEGIEF